MTVVKELSGKETMGGGGGGQMNEAPETRSSCNIRKLRINRALGLSHHASQFLSVSSVTGSVQ